MASDLDASVTQDLLQRSLDPVQGASQPTANFSSFNSDRIIALDADSLNPRQASLIDNASRLTKVDYAPTAYLTQFRNQVPSQGQLQGAMIGNSIIPQLDLNSSSNNVASTSSTTFDANSAEANSIASGSFFSGLFTPSVRATNSRVHMASQSTKIQWVGAFCDADGKEVFPSSQFSNVVLSPLPEGEGEDDEPIVPEVDFPTLESSGHFGAFDLFSPPTQSTSSSLTTFGAFTAASLTNPDLTLPGLNWVHSVDIYWVSPTQWSFTESLVLSFDLENSIEDEGQESMVSGQGGNEDGTDGDEGPGETADDEDTGLDVESEWESSIGASRSGYFKFTFNASRGITTTSAAGVRWSLLVDYLDSASVSAEASGSADFTPSDPPENNDGGSSNGDDEPGAGGVEGGTGRDAVDPPQFPDDFTATSKWKASARISVETSGIIIVSSTPAIASDGEIDRTVAASITFDVEGDIEVSEEWSSSSQSGDISLVDFPVVDGEHPLGGCGTGIFDDDDASGDDNNEEGDNEALARGENDYSPMGEIEGTGHASMSGGKSINNAGGGLNGSFGLNGVLRNGRFSSLIGNALSDLETTRESSGDGNHLFVFRDHKVIPIQYGETESTIELTAGWRGKGTGDGTADGDGDLTLGIGSDALPDVDNESSGEVDGDSNVRGDDFVNLVFDERSLSASDTLSQDPLGNPVRRELYDKNNFNLIYKSRSHGTSLGDVYGFASVADRSADFESELAGKGSSMLLVISDFENSSKLTIAASSQEFKDKLYQTEVYFDEYELTGNASGIKNDDESVTWTLDSEINSESSIDYDSSRYILNTFPRTNADIIDHQVSNASEFWRTARFDASIATQSSIVGGGTISPQPGGDTGSLTATESSTRAGDAEVSVTASDGLSTQKTELELELEAIFGSYDELEYMGGGDDTAEIPGIAADGSHTGKWGTSVSNSLDVGWAFGLGLLQGVCNLAERSQNSAIELFNKTPVGQAMDLGNEVTGYLLGEDLSSLKLQPVYWSRDRFTHEGGTPGGWDDTHGWSGWLSTEGSMMLLTAGASGAASLADDAVRLAPSSAVAHSPSPGVIVRKVGNYFIKEIDQNAGPLARWFGARSLRVQSEALTKLGDMAPSHLLKNGKLITRDAGAYTPGNFWSTWAKGSWRLGTPVNDIRPRNIGANGIIFDPAIDPLFRPFYWTAGGGVVIAGGWGIYELLDGDD